MGRVADWWSNRALGGEWQVPISSVQGFRPVGGFLIGTGPGLEFVPNRFEAAIGAQAWAVTAVERATLGRRTLKITADDGRTRTLFTNRPARVRHLLGAHLR